MSLLDSGARYEDITVYLDEPYTDSDGNPSSRPSTTGTPAKARFQPLSQSGTSARLQESANQGFESQEVYSMRFPRVSDAPWDGYPLMGPQSEVEWNGERWAVFGFPAKRNNSTATAHVSYQVKRY